MADEAKKVEEDALELEARAVGMTRDELLKLRADIHRMWNPADQLTLRGEQEADKGE